VKVISNKKNDATINYNCSLYTPVTAITSVVRVIADAQNVDLALPHKRNGLTDALEKARSVAVRGAAVVNARRQFLCSVHR
jgi:hypothetical protein